MAAGWSRKPNIRSEPAWRPGVHPLSRAAVTRQGAAKHARTRELGCEIAGDDKRSRTGAEDMRRVASPQGLTADPAHNFFRSAGVGAAILADLAASVPSEKKRASSARPLRRWQATIQRSNRERSTSQGKRAAHRSTARLTEDGRYPGLRLIHKSTNYLTSLDLLRSLE